MRLTMDIGNTRAKWALFDGDRMVDNGTLGEGLPTGWQEMETLVCTTGEADLHALGLEGGRLRMLDADTPLPITLDYSTPATLGADRIAAACGAHKAGKAGCAKLIVDAGTCITIDYLDGNGVYHGGAILPGIAMKFRALHTFTAKLPLLEDVDPCQDCVTGRSTRESMEAGVLTATRYEVEGFVNHYLRQVRELQVLMTGGDAERLRGAGLLKVDNLTVEPHLVMTGLNEILTNLAFNV